MNLYVESSAVLAVLFGEAAAADVLESLKAAEVVASSVLTLVECDRVLSRLAAGGRVDAEGVRERRAHLGALAERWTIVPLDEPVTDRARLPFPREPLRSLDALHVATAVTLRDWPGEMVVLSLDRRVRDNARALGFDVLPSTGPASG